MPGLLAALDSLDRDAAADANTPPCAVQVQPNTTAISGTVPRGTYYLQSRAATEVSRTVKIEGW